MGSSNGFLTAIKHSLANIGWRLFIWGNSYTEEQYWNDIYEQEVNYRNSI